MQQHFFWRSPSFLPHTAVNTADMVPHAATSGAAGLMGRIVGSMFAGVYMGFVVDHFGWMGGFISLIASCVLAIFFLFMTMGGKKTEVVN